MMIKIFTLFVTILFFPFILFSQEIGLPLNKNKEDLNVLYRNEMTGGLVIHSGGFGLNFRRGVHVTGFKKRILEIEVVNMKHPKEIKIINPDAPGNSNSGFYYGKINSLLILRPGVGYQKILYGKAERKSVEIRYCYFLGPSLGLVKPVYLEVHTPSDPLRTIAKANPFDPNQTVDRIYGRAPYFKGFDEMKVYPGGYAKLGLSFEYADFRDDIKAIETGVMVDVYSKTVPIMALTKNKQVFLSFYITFVYGKKWF